MTIVKTPHGWASSAHASFQSRSRRELLRTARRRCTQTYKVTHPNLAQRSSWFLSSGNFMRNSVVGMVMRYSAAPVESSRSNLPPMLGGPSCPPRNMTDRSATPPLVLRPSLANCHRPECSLVGAPIAKRIVTVNVEDPSPNLASASSRSPSRVPRSCFRVNEDRFPRPLRSSTGGFAGLAHAPRRMAKAQSGTRVNARLGKPTPEVITVFSPRETDVTRGLVYERKLMPEGKVHGPRIRECTADYHSTWIWVAKDHPARKASEMSTGGSDLLDLRRFFDKLKPKLVALS